MECESSSSQHRLVHFDLKGAPPKLAYYEWMLPLLSKWGATGLLVEYEDMFPYSGNLKELGATNAYSLAEVEQLQLLAKKNNLIVIPLIQTFGHFEFVLKHDKFRHLREVSNCPMTVCPLHEGTLPLITEMIDQMLQAHADDMWLHIGADEVFHVGLCDTCDRYMKQNNMLPVNLFLMHVRRILDYVRSQYSNIRTIMWDDMFRGIDVQTLQASGIGELVEPMVWYYQTVFHLPSDIWSRYVEVFGGLWVASAFKGATGPCANATDVGYHVENHKEWLNVVNSNILPLTDKFRGYAITGWQRYDHYSVLCELLPVGLPSLSLSLLILTTGAFTREIHETASEDLNFTELIPLSIFQFLESDEPPRCNFLGCEIYCGIHRLLRLKADYKQFIKNDRLKGWMSDWHVKNNYTNPVHLNHFLPHAQRLLQNSTQLKAELQTALLRIFYEDTVDEWLTVCVEPMIRKLTTVVDTATKQIELGARVKNYVESVDSTQS